MVMATPDSVRTHRPADSNHTCERGHGYPQSPFRIPSTPRTRPSHATHAARLSYSAGRNVTPKRDGRDLVLGSPFSVTRARYTTADAHVKGERVKGIEHARQVSVASVHSTLSDDARQKRESHLGQQESLADTPSHSRTRRSTSGSSCSGSGTSSASLLSLGRSSEEGRRYSVAIWDENVGDAIGGIGDGMARGGKGLFGEAYETLHGAQSSKAEGRKEQNASGRGEDVNASMVTLPAPPRHLATGSLDQNDTNSFESLHAQTRQLGAYTDLTPPHTHTHNHPAPPSTIKSTPVRRKSPFHFIPRLIPAYRRRTRAPSNGIDDPGSAVGTGKGKLDGEEGLGVTIHDQSGSPISPVAVQSGITPTTAEALTEEEMGLGIAIGPVSTHPFASASRVDGTAHTRTGDNASSVMLGLTPTSPSTTLLPRPTAIGTTRFNLAHSFDDDDDLEMPSPSKPPTGRRPGNPRRATATGVSVAGNDATGAAGVKDENGSMLAPSAFTLSPDSRSNSSDKRPNPPGSGSSIRSNDSTSRPGSGSSRPSIRRGITAPGAFGLRSLLHSDTGSSSTSKPQFATPPPLFNDIRPSPAAFASTGLIKKKSGMRGYGADGVVGAKGMGELEGMYSPAPVSRLGFDRFARLALRAGKAGKDRGTGESRLGKGIGQERAVAGTPGSTDTRPSLSTSSNASYAHSQSTSHSQPHSTSHSTSQSTSSHIPPGRGLRRKGSTMFSSSGSISISSISSVAPLAQPTTGASMGTGTGRNRSGSAMSAELQFGSSMGRTASVGPGFGLGMAVGGMGGSPVTPTKGAFMLPGNYNTITPPPHRPNTIAYPFARTRPTMTPATVAEHDQYPCATPPPLRAVEGGLDSPCAGLSPVVSSINNRTRCLGASTSTTASTSASTDTESTGTGSPLGARFAGIPATNTKVKGAMLGRDKSSAPFGHGPLVRASNPMLGHTFQHGQQHQYGCHDTHDGRNDKRNELNEGDDVDDDDDEATDVDDDLDVAEEGEQPAPQGQEVTTSTAENDQKLTIRSSRPGRNDRDSHAPQIGTHATAKHKLGASSNTAINRNARAGCARSSYTSGSKLDTDFVLVQGIGAGEFSQVWKVRSRKDGRLSAVKAGKGYTGVKNRLRQLEEVSILHTLREAGPPLPLSEPTTASISASHPHVLTFLSAWEHKSRLYIQTALSPLGDLARFLEACGDTAGLGEVRAWKSLVELTDALRFIHQQGIVHLDIKPGNVFIEKNGSVRVGDFGMAARLKRRGVDSVAGQEGGAWCSTGVETSLAEPPARAKDGSFYWPDNQGTTATGATDHAKQASQASQALSPTPLLQQHYTSPSPMLERDVEGDREYLSPEALNDDAVQHVGTHSDVFGLGIMLLEAVGNVALPSNGDGWHRLRNDDFTDFADCFVSRSKQVVDAAGRVVSTLDKRQGTDTNLPVLSDELLGVIKGLMRSDPAGRMTLDEVWDMEVVQRVRRLMRETTAGASRAGRAGAVWCGALIEEEDDAVELLFPRS